MLFNTIFAFEFRPDAGSRIASRLGHSWPGHTIGYRTRTAPRPTAPPDRRFVTSPTGRHRFAVPEVAACGFQPFPFGLSDMTTGSTLARNGKVNVMNSDDFDSVLNESVQILKEIRSATDERLDTGLAEELDKVIRDLEELDSSVIAVEDKRTRTLELAGRAAVLLSYLKAIAHLFDDSA